MVNPLARRWRLRNSKSIVFPTGEPDYSESAGVLRDPQRGNQSGAQRKLCSESTWYAYNKYYVQLHQKPISKSTQSGPTSGTDEVLYVYNYRFGEVQVIHDKESPKTKEKWHELLECR